MSRHTRAHAIAAILIGIAVFLALLGLPRLAIATLGLVCWLLLWSLEKIRASIRETKS